MEKRLGVKLFERTRAGYVPTANGELTAAVTNAMEAQALAVQRQIAALARHLSKEIPRVLAARQRVAG